MIYHDGKIERGYDTPIFIALNTDDGRKHHTIANENGDSGLLSRLRLFAISHYPMER